MIGETADGAKIEFDEAPFASGAIGAVHHTADRRGVVKLYHAPDPELRARLELVVGKYNCVGTDPYWRSVLCWPESIVVKPKLGIRMPAVRGMKSLVWMVAPLAYRELPPESKDWQSRLAVAVHLARAVRRLHGSGLAHGDLSPNNVLCDPRDGRVTILDLDSLVVPGFLPPQVDGTRDYIAPEILAGRSTPSIETDRHALAVLLYQLLLFYHPFKGPKVYSDDPEEDLQLSLGDDALFIEHPTDDSNRPPEIFPLSIVGDGLADLFRRAFVEGLRKPSARPTAAQWEDLLVRLADRVLRCSNFGCVDRHFPVSETFGFTCPWCRTPAALDGPVPVLRFYSPKGAGGSFVPDRDLYVVGTEGRMLHSWHARVGALPDPGGEPAVATIERREAGWVLVNTNEPGLRQLLADGLMRPVAVGAEVPLADGVRLLFDEPPFGRLAYVQTVGP